MWKKLFTKHYICVIDLVLENENMNVSFSGWMNGWSSWVQQLREQRATTLKQRCLWRLDWLYHWTSLYLDDVAILMFFLFCHSYRLSICLAVLDRALTLRLYVSNIIWVSNRVYHHIRSLHKYMLFVRKLHPCLWYTHPQNCYSFTFNK